MRAAYMPVLVVGKTVNFARDYSYRWREMEGRFGERVETIDQKVGLQRMTCVVKQFWATGN
jgi:hypothetical protein